MLALRRLTFALQSPRAGYRIAALDLAVSYRVRDIPRAMVPDMPDRIIAATALSRGLPLVTRDARIRSTEIETIW